MLKKFLEAVVAVAVEEAVRAFFPAWLPYVWFVILALLTLELARSPWPKRHLVATWVWLKGKNAILAYVIAVALVAATCTVEGWTVHKALIAMHQREHANNVEIAQDIARELKPENQKHGSLGEMPKSVSAQSMAAPDKDAEQPVVPARRNKLITKPTQRAALRTELPSPPNQVDQSAVYCKKVDHLPQGMTANCADLEVSDNRFSGFTSAYENDGKTENLTASGNLMRSAPADVQEPQAMFQNRPGATIGGSIRLDDNTDSTGGPIFTNDGQISGDVTGKGNVRERGERADWLFLLNAVKVNIASKSTIELIVANLRRKMEHEWTNLAEDLRKKNTEELEAIIQTFLADAGDAEKFSKDYEALRRSPPSFEFPAY